MRTFSEQGVDRTDEALGECSRIVGLTRVLGGILLFALLHNPLQAVQSVTLAWDPSPDLSVVGYNMYYGVASRNYTNVVVVGNATNVTLSGFIEGTTYYFAATAYNAFGLESDVSNEAGYTIPLSNNAPTITLTSPSNGSGYTAPATINLAASVAANGHTITKAQFYNRATLLGEDTSAPYSLMWSNVSAGSYSLTARAVYDTGSTVASSAANVTVAAVNTAPAITDVVDQTINEDTAAGPLAFTVGDAETAAGSLTVSGTSSSPTLVPNGNIVFGGTGASRTVTVTPLANQSGTATITVTVSDGVLSAKDTFVLTVSAAPSGLVAAYGFNEGTGTTVADVSGNTLTGTINGAAWTTGGKYGNALSFNGTSSYVDLGNPAALQLTGSMTWSAWVKAAANPADDGQVVAKSDGASGWQFKTSPDTGPHTFGVGVSGSGGSIAQRYSVATRSLNVWYHVAGVYNAAAATLDVYVNGVLDNGTLVGTIPAAQVNSAVNVNIGRRTGGFLFNGIIDEVRIYNRALSAAEIQSDLNTPVGGSPPSNTAPTISDITDRAINEDANTGAIAFTVGDAETAVRSLAVSSSSSNPTLVPNGNIVFGGSGANRTVTVTPTANQNGTATITVTVSDGALTASDSFVLTVSAVNDAPTISDIVNQTTTSGVAVGPLSFTVGDVETAAGSLTVSGTSSNPALVPNGNIVFGGTGASRTVTVTPAANQTGTATLTVTVSDGALSASDTFVLTVNAVTLAPTIALTAPLSGASYTAPATISLAASVTANGHTITKAQFYNGATLLGEDTSAPYSLLWSNVSAGSYSLTARAVYDTGSTVASSPVNMNVIGLPAPWQTTDIGSVGVVGSASMSNGLYTVNGAGNLSGTADNFRFVYQPLSGDGEIKVRLNSVGSTGTSGRIGVVIRESLSSGSKYAFMGIRPDGTFRWQRRSTTSGSTSSTTSTIGIPPNAWTRLVRTGNTLYGYQSTDGTNWTQVNSRSITMATNIYVGLAVASGSSNTLNTATFSNLTVVP
jgi:hypothetical protein